MYIRRTTTRRNGQGERYASFRLVESRREGNQVRQVTLLNLGSQFDLPEADWPLLCVRLAHLLGSQASLLPAEVPTIVETTAQALKARLVAAAPTATQPAEFAEVDVASLELVQPRTVGVEQIGLYALAQLQFEPLLQELGINAITRAMIVAQVVGRMAAPGSERATWSWLTERSALGELLDLTIPTLSVMRLYRSADVLLKHQAAIEARLFARVQGLFDLQPTVSLYDLTNTYFEGAAAANRKARRGHSKEQRTDCPLLTLGLVLDGSGFVQRSRVLAGNVSEGQTLEGMLKDLATPAGALIVMDRGIATEANLTWLRQAGYRYLVVSRERGRVAPTGTVTVLSAGGETIRVEKVLDAEAKEVRLFCHSPGRERKEVGISERFATRFEAGLAKLAAGLTRPRGTKDPEAIQQRLGRLKQASRGAAQHYVITVETDPANTAVTALRWERQPVPGTMATAPGVYCLRSNETSWDEERLWRTYMMLTDLEAVFRSLKSELGLRPVFHAKESRCDAHLFITVLAYQCVQLVRAQLRAKDLDLSWRRLRDLLSVQQRVTACFRQKDGRTLQVRKATQPEPLLKAVYDALGITPLPGGTKKHVH